MHVFIVYAASHVTIRPTTGHKQPIEQPILLRRGGLLRRRFRELQATNSPEIASPLLHTTSHRTILLLLLCRGALCTTPPYTTNQNTHTETSNSTAVSSKYGEYHQPSSNKVEVPLMKHGNKTGRTRRRLHRTATTHDNAAGLNFGRASSLAKQRRRPERDDGDCPDRRARRRHPINRVEYSRKNRCCQGGVRLL